MTRQKDLERLLGPETERLRREHPDLSEQLRRYQEAWRTFRKSVGGDHARRPPRPLKQPRYRV